MPRFSVRTLLIATGVLAVFPTLILTGGGFGIAVVELLTIVFLFRQAWCALFLAGPDRAYFVGSALAGWLVYYDTRVKSPTFSGLGNAISGLVNPAGEAIGLRIWEADALTDFPLVLLAAVAGGYYADHLYRKRLNQTPAAPSGATGGRD